MSVQLDGSHHAWLEDRGPKFALLPAVVNATTYRTWVMDVGGGGFMAQFYSALGSTGEDQSSAGADRA